MEQMMIKTQIKSETKAAELAVQKQGDVIYHDFYVLSIQTKAVVTNQGQPTDKQSKLAIQGISFENIVIAGHLGSVRQRLFHS